MVYTIILFIFSAISKDFTYIYEANFNYIREAKNQMTYIRAQGGIL